MYLTGALLFSNIFISDLDANLCLVTSLNFQHWASMVHWMVLSIIYAEAHDISMDESLSMPFMGSFGPRFEKMFQRAVATVGNYNELYERNLGQLLPRSSRNLLNKNPQSTIRGPSVYIPPGFGLEG